MKLRLPSKLVAAILAAASPVLLQTLSTATLGAAAVAVVAGQQATADWADPHNTEGPVYYILGNNESISDTSSTVSQTATKLYFATGNDGQTSTGLSLSVKNAAELHILLNPWHTDWTRVNSLTFDTLSFRGADDSSDGSGSLSIDDSLQSVTISSINGTASLINSGTLTLNGVSAASVGTVTNSGTTVLSGASATVDMLEKFNGTTGTVQLGNGEETLELTLGTKQYTAQNITVANGVTLNSGWHNDKNAGLSQNVKVLGGGTLATTGNDVLGWSDGATKSITLVGQDADHVATLALGGRQTMKTNLILSGFTGVTNTTPEGTAESNSGVLDMYGGKITATGTENNFSANIALRSPAEIEVTGADDVLTVSGKVYSETGRGTAGGEHGTLTKTGSGLLELSNAANEIRYLNLNAGTIKISGTTAVNTATTVAADAALMLNGGTLNLSGTAKLGGGVSGSGTLSLGSVVYEADSGCTITHSGEGDNGFVHTAVQLVKADSLSNITVNGVQSGQVYHADTGILDAQGNIYYITQGTSAASSAVASQAGELSLDSYTVDVAGGATYKVDDTNLTITSYSTAGDNNKHTLGNIVLNNATTSKIEVQNGKKLTLSGINFDDNSRWFYQLSRHLTTSGTGVIDISGITRHQINTEVDLVMSAHYYGGTNQFNFNGHNSYGGHEAGHSFTFDSNAAFTVDARLAIFSGANIVLNGGSVQSNDIMLGYSTNSANRYFGKITLNSGSVTTGYIILGKINSGYNNAIDVNGGTLTLTRNGNAFDNSGNSLVLTLGSSNADAPAVLATGESNSLTLNHAATIDGLLEVRAATGKSITMQTLTSDTDASHLKAAAGTLNLTDTNSLLNLSVVKGAALSVTGGTTTVTGTLTAAEVISNAGTLDVSNATVNVVRDLTASGSGITYSQGTYGYLSAYSTQVFSGSGTETTDNTTWLVDGMSGTQLGATVTYNSADKTLSLTGAGAGRWFMNTGEGKTLTYDGTDAAMTSILINAKDGAELTLATDDLSGLSNGGIIVNDTAAKVILGGEGTRTVTDGSIRTVGTGTVQIDNAENTTAVYKLVQGNRSFAAANTTLADTWRGTVVMNGVQETQRTEGGVAFDFNSLGNANSTVQLINSKLAVQNGEYTYDGNVILGDGSVATQDGDFRIVYGSTPGTLSYTFNGGVSGVGNMVNDWADQRETVNITFNGDVSEWTGAFKQTATSTANLTFGGEAHNVNALITRSAGTLNLAVNTGVTFTKQVQVSSLSIADGASATFDMGGTQTTLTLGTISGSGDLTLKGGAQLTPSFNGSFSGNILVDGEGSRLTYNGSLGANNASTARTITIQNGGVFDVDGKPGSLVNNCITLGQGGMLVNDKASGSDTGATKAQLANLKLTGDAAVGGVSIFGLLGGNWNATALDMGGHTLTKQGINTYMLVNTTVSNGGTIKMADGTIQISAADKNKTTDANGTLFSFAGGTLSFDGNNATLKVKGLVMDEAFDGNGAVTGQGNLEIHGTGEYSYKGTLGNIAITNKGTGTQSLTLSEAATTLKAVSVEQGKLIFDGAAATAASLSVAGAAEIGNAFTVTGALSGAGSVKLLHSETADGSLTVGGAATIGSLTLETGTSATFNGATTAISGLVMNGTASLQNAGALSLSGTAVLTDVTPSSTTDGYSEGTSGFAATIANITVVQNSGESATAASTVTSWTVNGNDVTSTASFDNGVLSYVSSKDTSTYYVNENMTFSNDSTTTDREAAETFNVAEGKTFTLANNKASGKNIVLNTGATLKGDGGGSNFNDKQLSSITLEGNATVQANVNFGLIGSPGTNSTPVDERFAPTTLDLKGHQLTVTGSSRFALFNTTVTEGTILIDNGYLQVGHSTMAPVKNVAAGNTLLKFDNNGKLVIEGGARITVEGLSGTGAVQKAGDAYLTIDANNTAENAYDFSGTLVDNLNLTMQGTGYQDINLTSAATLTTLNMGGSATLTLKGGSMTANSFTTADGSSSNLGISGTATLTVNSAAATLDSLNLADSATLNLKGGSMTANGFTATANNNINISGGASLTVNNSADGTLGVVTMGDTAHNHNNAITFSDAITISGLDGHCGTVNGTTLTINATTDHEFQHTYVDGHTEDHAVLNVSKLIKTGSATQTIGGEYNEGEGLVIAKGVKVQEGTLHMKTRGTVTANFDVSAGAHLLTSDDTSNPDTAAAAMTYNGTVTLHGTTADNAAELNYADGATHITGGLYVAGYGKVTSTHDKYQFIGGLYNAADTTSNDITFVRPNKDSEGAPSIVALTASGDFVGTVHINNMYKKGTARLDEHFGLQVLGSDAQNALAHAVIDFDVEGANQSQAVLSFRTGNTASDAWNTNKMDGVVAGLKGEEGSVYAENLTINTADGQSYAYNGKLSVSGFTKNGSGTQEIGSNVDSFRGPIVVNDGKLVFNGLRGSISNLHIVDGNTAKVHNNGQLVAGNATLKANGAQVAALDAEGDTPATHTGTLSNATFAPNALKGEGAQGGTLAGGLLEIADSVTYSISDMTLTNSVVDAENAVLNMQNVNIDAASSVVAGTVNDVKSTLSGSNRLTLSAGDTTKDITADGTISSSQLTGLTLNGNLTIDLSEHDYARGVSDKSKFSIVLSDFTWQDLIDAKIGSYDAAAYKTATGKTLDDVFKVIAVGGNADVLHVLSVSNFNSGIKIEVQVPEPTTSVLSLLALAGMAARRRRK